MSAINGFRQIDINLSQQRTADLRGPSKRVLLVSGVAAFFLIIGLVWGFMVKATISELDQQLMDGQSQIGQLQAQLQQMNANGRLDIWKDLPAAIERNNQSPLKIFGAFAKHLPSDAVVNNWTMDGTNRVRLDVDFGSTESIIRFRTTLAKDPFFRLVGMESFVNKPVEESPSDQYLPITSVSMTLELTGTNSSSEGAVRQP